MISISYKLNEILTHEIGIVQGCDILLDNKIRKMRTKMTCRLLKRTVSKVQLRNTGNTLHKVLYIMLRCVHMRNIIIPLRVLPTYGKFGHVHFSCSIKCP